jgi:glycosyltransferase involved in cell wall biosynthesis
VGSPQPLVIVGSFESPWTELIVSEFRKQSPVLWLDSGKFLSMVFSNVKFLAIQRPIPVALYGGKCAFQALVISLIARRRFAVYLVGSDVLLLSGVQRRLARVAYKLAFWRGCNGPLLATVTLQKWSMAVESIPHGIPLSGGNGSPALSDRDSSSLISTRTLAPIYDNQTVLRAVKLLEAENVSVTFAGRGDLPGMKSLTTRLKIEDRVFYLNGYERAGVDALLSRFGWFVSASLSDGLATSILEAAEAGIPMILSEIPASLALRDMGLHFIGFKVGDENSLAHAIRSGLSLSPEQIGRMVSANQDLVRTSFDSEVQCGKIWNRLHQRPG